MQTQNQPQLPPSAQMLQVINGYWTACCAFTVARLGVADHLAKNPQTVDQLAKLTGSHSESLYRVLRALAGVGIFAEKEPRVFEQTPLSDVLRSDSQGSMRALVVAELLNDHYSAWGELLHSVKTGEVAFQHLNGKSIWKHYEENSADGSNFVKAMENITGLVIAGVLPAYDFSSFSTIVDIGGGNGALLTAILERTPTAKGIVFDEAYVVEKAKETIRQKNLSARCSVAAGSFFQTIPVKADAYVIKQTLHDWNDKECTTILKNIAAVMNRKSVVLVLESVIPEGNVFHPGKLMDINMLAMTGGKERTEEEWSLLFQTAGLQLRRVVSTPTPLSIIEAVKA